MHGWKRNPKAPSSLWDGMVLDGAYAGLHPGTNRFVDGSGLENHGTLTNMNAATDWVWSDDIWRWALAGNPAIGGHVVIQDADSLTPLAGITLAIWARRANITAGNPLIDKYQAGGYEFVFGFAAATLYGFVYDNMRNTYRGRAVTGSQALAPAGEWVHIGWTYDGSQTTAGNKLFIRGVQRDNIDFSAGASPVIVRNTATPMSIGGPNPGLSTTSFAGNLADPMDWHRVLEQNEITWLADRSNRLYVEDTRRVVCVPASFNPALMRRRRRMAGAR